MKTCLECPGAYPNFCHVMGEECQTLPAYPGAGDKVRIRQLEAELRRMTRERISAPNEKAEAEQKIRGLEYRLAAVREDRDRLKKTVEILTPAVQERGKALGKLEDLERKLKIAEGRADRLDELYLRTHKERNDARADADKLRTKLALVEMFTIPPSLKLRELLATARELIDDVVPLVEIYGRHAESPYGTAWVPEWLEKARRFLRETRL